MWAPTFTDEQIRDDRAWRRDRDDAIRADLLTQALGLIREAEAEHMSKMAEHVKNLPVQKRRHFKMLLAIDMLETAAEKPEPRAADLIATAHEDSSEAEAFAASVLTAIGDNGYGRIRKADLLSMHARLQAANTALEAARATIALLREDP